jgi:hypothetical protein
MIKISYASEEEMMQISNSDGIVFYGNYWDFPRNPEELFKIIKQLTEQEVYIDKNLLI